MSSTNRGTVRDPKDFYATPREAFEPLLAILPWDVHYWEPCAGDGRLIRRLRESGRIASGADLFPQDIAAGIYPTEFGIDFLKNHTPREFIATNPPFSVAFEMCQHAVTVAPEVLFLLRLGFLGSDERKPWFQQHEPAALFPLSKRPSFVMSCTCKACAHNWLLPVEFPRPKACPVCQAPKVSISTSDSADYAWFYWGHRFQGIKHL